MMGCANYRYIHSTGPSYAGGGDPPEEWCGVGCEPGGPCGNCAGTVHDCDEDCPKFIPDERS